MNEYIHTYIHTDGQTAFYILLSLKQQSQPGELSRHSDSLLAGRSGDRISVWARFSAPVQTGPGVHQTSYTMDTGSLTGG